MKFLFLLLGLFAINSNAGVQSLKEAPVLAHEKGARIHFLAHPEVHGNKNAFIGLLEIPPMAKVPLHRDSTEEYLYVLSGGGKIWIDNKEYEIEKSDTVFMPAGAPVKFENGKQPTQVLQIFSGPKPMEKYKTESWKKASMKQGVAK